MVFQASFPRSGNKRWVNILYGNTSRIKKVRIYGGKIQLIPHKQVSRLRPKVAIQIRRFRNFFDRLTIILPINTLKPVYTRRQVVKRLKQHLPFAAFFKMPVTGNYRMKFPRIFVRVKKELAAGVPSFFTFLCDTLCTAWRIPSGDSSLVRYPSAPI
jgi:hypothetical protein